MASLVNQWDRAYTSKLRGQGRSHGLITLLSIVVAPLPPAVSGVQARLVVEQVEWLCSTNH